MATLESYARTPGPPSVHAGPHRQYCPTYKAFAGYTPHLGGVFGAQAYGRGPHRLYDVPRKYNTCAANQTMPAPVSHSPSGDTFCMSRRAALLTTRSTEETRQYVLVKQLAAGDPGALGALYKMTVPLLFSFARRMLSNAADAEEVICDVYTQVWQTAAQYDVTRGSVTSWLIMICRSRAIDRYRQNKCRSHGSDDHSYDEFVHGPCTPFESEDILQALQRSTAIHGAIEQLSPLRRRLLALAFFHDLSHETIAVTTNLALGTVKSHIRRALATLRKELEKSEAISPRMTGNRIYPSRVHCAEPSARASDK